METHEFIIHCFRVYAKLEPTQSKLILTALNYLKKHFNITTHVTCNSSSHFSLHIIVDINRNKQLHGYCVHGNNL